MRVLLTTDTVGGVWTYTKELTRGLLEGGHAVALVSFGRAPSKEQSAWCCRMETLYGDSFRYVAPTIALEWMENNEQAYADGEEVLLRMAREFGAELLHSNQFCFGALPVGIPKLVAAHSDVLSWARACRPGPLPASAWLARYVALVQRGLGSADAIVAPTKWMLDALMRSFKLKGRAEVIPNGRSLDLELVQPRRTLQAVTAGRLWDEGKGVASLLEMQSPMPILIVGEMRERMNLPESAKSVVMRGPLAADELLRVFQRSALYLVTSRYEPFGLAPLEAALCGCGVVARDLASLREVWADGAVYFQDSEELEHLLRQLTDDAPRLGELQRRSRQRALQYDRATMTGAYLQLYGHMLTNRSPAPEHESRAVNTYAS